MPGETEANGTTTACPIEGFIAIPLRGFPFPRKVSLTILTIHQQLRLTLWHNRAHFTVGPCRTTRSDSVSSGSCSGFHNASGRITRRFLTENHLRSIVVRLLVVNRNMSKTIAVVTCPRPK